MKSNENEEHIPPKKDFDDQSLIEQVALTMPTTNDTTILVCGFSESCHALYYHFQINSLGTEGNPSTLFQSLLRL